jgi:hypothetical protein
VDLLLAALLLAALAGFPSALRQIILTGESAPVAISSAKI